MRPLRIALVMIEPPLPAGNAAARWFSVLLRGLVATHDAAPAALEYYIFGADIHEGSIPFQSAFIL